MAWSYLHIIHISRCHAAVLILNAREKLTIHYRTNYGSKFLWILYGYIMDWTLYLFLVLIIPPHYKRKFQKLFTYERSTLFPCWPVFSPPVFSPTMFPRQVFSSEYFPRKVFSLSVFPVMPFPLQLFPRWFFSLPFLYKEINSWKFPEG